MSVTQKWLTLLPFKKYIWDKIKITRLATGWFLFVWDLCSKSANSECVNDCVSSSTAQQSTDNKSGALAPLSSLLFIFSISSFEKSSSWEFFSPFTNVFLLWLKDARISLNISFSLSTCTGGSSYLTSWITALPTFGLGIKQFGGTFAMICGLA